MSCVGHESKFVLLYRRALCRAASLRRIEGPNDSWKGETIKLFPAVRLAGCLSRRDGNMGFIAGVGASHYYFIAWTTRGHKLPMYERLWYIPIPYIHIHVRRFCTSWLLTSFHYCCCRQTLVKHGPTAINIPASLLSTECFLYHVPKPEQLAGSSIKPYSWAEIYICIRFWICDCPAIQSAQGIAECVCPVF